MSLSLKQQLSQLQSKLDSKRSRSRSRSKTPKKESMNSAQRRRKNNPNKKKPVSAAERRAVKDEQDRKNVAKAKGAWTGEVDLVKAMDMAPPEVKLKFLDLWDKYKKAAKRASDAGLNVWDPKVTVQCESGNRFQTFKEWKESLPKPSMLTEALKQSDKKCNHDYITVGLSPPSTICRFCQKKEGDVKGGELKDTVIDQLRELYEAACVEFEAAREVMRAGLKNKPIRMRLSASFAIATTVTTGVTNTVTIGGGNKYLDIATCSEWSTLTALFDEFKCTGGEVVFNYVNPIQIVATPSITSDSMPIMSYEVDASAAATSSLQLTQSAQHKVFDAFPLVGALSAPAGIGCGASGLRHNFRWRVPGGTVSAANGNTIPGTQWQTVIGSTHWMGVIQFYHIGSVVATSTTGAGFVYFDAEFRCRV